MKPSSYTLDIETKPEPIQEEEQSDYGFGIEEKRSKLLNWKLAPENEEFYKEIPMILSEKIGKDIEKLPFVFQTKVFDYVRFLLVEANKNIRDVEDIEWSRFSLEQAMRGMEDDDEPTYTISDMKLFL